MKKNLFTFLLALFPLFAFADAVEIDGIYYNLLSKGNIAEVAYNPNKYSGDVVIPSSIVYENTEYSVEIIAGGAFNNCLDLTSVNIPNSVKKIGERAFGTCIKLKSIVIPKGVEIIRKNTFYQCQELQSITIPSTVTTIEGLAFDYCDKLQRFNITSLEWWINLTFGGHHGIHLFINNEEIKEVTIPSSVIEIRDCLFSGCEGIESVVLHNGITSIGKYAFADCGFETINIPESVLSIGDFAFYNNSKIKDVTIPENVLSVGNSLFWGCSSLETVNLPNSITKLDGTFGYCTSLKEVTIPDGVKELRYAFCGCTSLSSIIIPNSVEDIGYSSFYGCSNLQTVKIGSGVISVSWESFVNCKNLSEVYCYATNVPNTDSGAFSGSYIEYATLFVPSSSIEQYKATEPWKSFGNIIGLPKYHLTYLVDNEVYKDYELEENTAITPEQAATKEGYTFSGWSDIPSTMPAHDVTVTGTFSINTYKLTYKVDGVGYKTLDVEYDATITPEPAPTKEGYTFSGWSEIPATMPAHDVTVTGTFSINTYKLTYKVDGVVYKTLDVEYGTTITPETEPTKEGYTFSGWSEIPATMPAHDVTVTGTFAVNKYKLTYKVDGEVYKTYDVEYGATITPEAAPTKEGYTFSGWSEIPATMPAHDVTVTGTFTQETGIDQIMDSENGKATIFTIDGKRVDNPKKGVNVIRMKDGTTRKVVVK